MTSTLICWANSVPSLFPCKRKKSESGIDTISTSGPSQYSIINDSDSDKTYFMNYMAMPDNDHEKCQEYEAYNYMLYLMGLFLWSLHS